MCKLRRFSIPAACGLIMIGGCSSPDAPPPPSTAAQPPPIDKPIDISSYLNQPCSAVPETVDAQFGLNHRQESKIASWLKSQSAQSSCELAATGKPQPGIGIRFAAVRPLPLLKSQGDTLTPTQVHGYPAGIWKIDLPPDSFTSCQAIVDLGPNQGMGVLYNGPPHDTADGCALAQQTAELVVTKLESP
jgi:hypothetical protein